jgi:hypothetical protein
MILMLAMASLFGNPALAENAATPPRSNAQLEQLVAPIALYPDSLLSQVLMASTYPLEVVEAARWVQQNSNVTGKALEDAMQKQSWDPSVKALTSVPQTLQMMNDKLDWTQQLGDAFLAQQKDMLDAVQRLRARADAAGHLQTTEQQKVTRTPRPSSGGPASAATPALVYSIETANPEVYYVPIYDPGAVYGAWPYPDYAPFYWFPPGYVASGVFSFAAAAFVGAAVWGHVDWRRNRVGIDVNRFNRFNRTNIANNTWTHDPTHRRGAPYRDSGVAARFGDQGRAAAREAFRGQADAGRRDLAKQGGKADTGRRDVAKQGGKSNAKAKTAARSKSGAKSNQAARSKQASHAKQAQRSRPQAGGQSARQRTATQQHRPAARRNPGAGARAQQVRSGGHQARPGGRGGGHGGGGGRGGGGRRR